MLDDGRYGSVSELAAAEKLDRGYLGRILMLTLLAPDIVEAILDGRQPAELGVHVLREGFPVEWGEQRSFMVAAGRCGRKTLTSALEQYDITSMGACFTVTR